MTTELEQQFFKVFGIEKRCLFPNLCKYEGICKGKVACEHYTYPEISAEKLLKIICLINTYDDRLLFKTSYDELKNEILKLAIETGTNEGVVNYQQFKQQVLSLFEKGE